MTTWEAAVAKARKRHAGAFDRLDPPTIAYLAEVFRVEVLEQDEEARWSQEERSLFKSTATSVRESGGVLVAPWEGKEAQRWAVKARETLEASLPDYRRLRAEGDLEGILDQWRGEAMDLAVWRFCPFAWWSSLLFSHRDGIDHRELDLG